MKPPAVVSLLWGKNQNLLPAFVGPARLTLLSLQALCDVALADAVARAGGRVQALEGLLDDGTALSLAGDIDRLRREFEALTAGADWRALHAEHGMDGERLAAVFTAGLDQRLLHPVLLIEALERAAEQYDIRLLVVNDDWQSQPRAAVEWARMRAIPSLHVAHGGFLAHMYTVHSALNADCVAVFGPRGAEGYLDIGVAPERIVATGNPAWDIYARLDEVRPALRAELRRRHALGERPTLVYATTWMAWLTAFDHAGRFAEGVRAFLSAAKVLRAAGRDWNFVVKDRPSNAGQGERWTREIAVGLGLADTDYLYVSDDALPWVACADAVVASDSNLLIEAMHAGTPAINLMSEFGLVMGPSFDADSGLVEVAVEDLAATLAHMMEAPAFRAERIAAMRARLPHYNAGHDGSATARVVALMRLLAGLDATAAAAETGPERVHVWQSLGETAGERDHREFYTDLPRQEVVAQFGHPPRRVLEIGCATGATARHIKSIYPGAWVAGIELSEMAASMARERMDLVIGEKFEAADLEAHGIGPGSIDTVIVADVLEHMYDPWGVLIRLKPYLSADAQVIASIPNSRNLWLLNELAHGRFPYASVGLLDITHIRFFTREEIDKLFAETGYAVESWLRTPDPRLMHLELKPGMTAVETDKFVLKDVGVEEFEDLKSLQFVVRARPLNAAHAGSAQRPRRRSGVPRLAVYALDPPEGARAQRRFFRPVRALAGACELSWAVYWQDGRAAWEIAPPDAADAVILSRLFPSGESRALIEAAFASGKPVIYDADAALLDVLEGDAPAGGAAGQASLVEATLRRAHAVVARTPALAARLRRYNERLHVLPDLVDYTLFQRTPPDNGRQVHIGVVGGGVGEDDFALVDEALRRICGEYGKRIRVRFVGTAPAGWKDHPNADFIPFMPDYGAYAARMKGLDLDIGLAPLADDARNACRSPVPWLEFAALGMAAVCSAVPPYRDVVEQGKTGLLVDNKTEKWVAALKLLIDNPDFRLELALAAQLKAYQEHSLQRQGYRVGESYRRLLDTVPDGPAGSVPPPAVPEAADAALPDFYDLWQAGHAPREADLRWIAARMAAWGAAAEFHLGIICRAGDEGRLGNNIKSLANQFHKGWRLTVVAECPAPEELAALPQVAWIACAPDAAIERLNQALATGTAAWVGMIEAGDRLPPHATFALADALARHPEWRMLYSDEDRLDEDGTRHTPFFKTDFDPDMLRAAPFSLGGLLLLERGLFAGLGGFRAEAEGMENWDLALRASERLDDGSVGHLADVLYHRFESGGHSRRDAETVRSAARDSLAGHLRRRGWPAEIEDGLLPGSFRIRYRVTGTPLVSILIPSKNQLGHLRACLTSLVEGTGYSHCEVLVVDNGSDDPETLDFLQALRDLGSANLRVLSHPGPFNFAALNNRAAAEARGEFLLLLNNDTQVLHEDWLEEMLGYAQRADVGAVGARLLYPDGGVQHAGVVLGLGGVACNHVAQKAAADDPGYYGRLQLPQNYSALTAACLLTRKAHYEAAGGLDEAAFQVNFNDVDYCLKLRERGLKVVWTPHAVLRHDESVSQNATGVECLSLEDKQVRLFKEVEAIVGKWPRWFARDPAYNRNLSLILPFQPEPTPALTWDPEWRPAPRVLSIHADAMGCGEYRIIAPMRALTRAGKLMGWDAAGYFHPREYARMDPDAIVFQRQVEWGQIEFIQRISRISRAFRIFELDDLITNIPIMSSQKKLFVEQKDVAKRFRKAVSLCQRFVVSTDYLAEAFKGYCDEIVVVPNYLERARWDGHAPRRRGGGRARVGWAGSATHAGDLRLIVDVVKATADEVDWVFFGMCPDPIRPLVREFHEPVKLDDYPARLASLDLDLAIAPLEDIPFNHGKSHLRLLEYGIMGYPVICSDITPYRGDYPVTRVPNKFKAWVEAIREQVADRDALARRGDLMREHVERHWMLEDHLDVWLRAWLPG